MPVNKRRIKPVDSPVLFRVLSKDADDDYHGEFFETIEQAIESCSDAVYDTNVISEIRTVLQVLPRKKTKAELQQDRIYKAYTDARQESWNIVRQEFGRDFRFEDPEVLGVFRGEMAKRGYPNVVA